MTQLTEAELAERWRVTPRTLQMWRRAKKGPRFLPLGDRTIRYRLEDIEAYERANAKGTDIRSTVNRAASAMDMLAAKAANPKARATLAALSQELRALLK